MISLFKPFIATDQSIVNQTLHSGQIAQGPRVDELEQKLGALFHTNDLILVNSCTSALQLSLEAVKRTYDIPEGSEVISTSLTCAATNMAIVNAGFKIKWADIDEFNYNIDLEDVERKLSYNNRIVMIVHWGGNPIDYDKLIKLNLKYREKYGQDLIVIEDCAHCWTTSKFKIPGSNFNRITGTLLQEYRILGYAGPISYSCFSTQAIKFLTTGDGGFIIAPHNGQTNYLRKLRWFGLDRTKGESFRSSQDIYEVGYKYQMNDIAASIGLANLADVNKMAQKHIDNANYYKSHIGLVDNQNQWILNPGLYPSNSQSSYWLYTLRVSDRERFIEKMKSAEIQCNMVHQRNDKLSCFKQFSSFLPTMDKIEKQYVAIPVGWHITKEEKEHIVKTIKGGW